MHGAIYPFFLHSIYTGLVPPFSRFFTAVLDHYGIQALHLQPNSMLLLSVFAFYYEASVGMQTSFALLRHFFSLRLHGGAHLSACISFMVVERSSVLLKAGKKVENFRHHSVLMCLKDAKPWLEEPKELLEKTSAWSSAKLSDPRIVPVLEHFSSDISAKRMTGGLIVKVFLAQRFAPLHEHSKTLWEYWAGDDELRRRSRDLPIEDLRRVVAILLGSNPGDLPEAVGPLYHRDDLANLVVAMPIFTERGLLPAEGSVSVEVSSGDTSGEGGLEKIVDDRAASVPLPSQSVLLRELEDDDATGDTSTGTPSRLARASTGPMPTTRAMRYLCVIASRKLGAEPSSAHPASVGGRSKVPRDVVSPGVKRKKTVKTKVTPDAPPALVTTWLSAGGEE
ncbi:hypothetical protein D1007_32666 [Hordeum vulgare]|nr:hypothetical protein D1007_32666 [Hordeum vulgare]